jgi:ABC-type dipeptide/oligopeptide/nickel transport systems, permease components
MMASTALQQVWYKFSVSKSAVIGLIFLSGIILLAIFAPLISPQNPYDLMALDIMDARLTPGSMSSDGALTYWLGTDAQGRDILSAILYGLRISLYVGCVTTVVALCIGLFIGLLAGYWGGKTEAILMRIADIQLSFPSILIAMILLALFGQGTDKIIIALVASQWAYYARTARSAALIERDKEYIQAGRVLGLSAKRILFNHLLPNCLPPLIVIAALQIAAAIALEATLSFLGIGLPATEPSLGLLIANGFQYIYSGKYWISIFPGVALLITIVAINLVADQLRIALNPE